MESEKEITRKEFYDKVWSITLKNIAEELNLPTQVLKQICKDYNVPIPKSGHWKKVEYGKPIVITPLDNLNTSDKKVIDFKKYISEYHDTFEFKLKQRILEIEEESSEHLRVPLRLTRPGSLISRARSYYSKQYGRKYKGFEDVISTGSEHLNISVRKRNVSRALRIMDTLIKLFERRGHSVQLQSWETVLIIKEQKFEIKFREKCNRVKVREGKWGTTDLVPNNLLSVKYARSYSTKEWVDSTSQPLENQIVKIVASFELMAEKEIEDSRQREIYWAEQERKEAIEKEKQARLNWEYSKVEILMKHLDQWQKYERHRKILEELKQTIGSDAIVEEWLTWAKLELEKTNPLSNGIMSFLAEYEYKSQKNAP